MHYCSEVEVMKVLGIDSWRNLSKDKIITLFQMLPEIDNELAVKLVGHLPEITAFVRSGFDGAAEAHHAGLASNARSQEALQELGLKRLEILGAELTKDLSAEERHRVLDDIREVHSRADQKDTENKAFLSDQSEKARGFAAVATLVFAGVLVTVAMSGSRPGAGARRILGL